MLLVEDELMVREVAAMMLRQLGYAVIPAGDGLEAVELFRRHQGEIVCVLCDVNMPRLDGWQTLEALRQLAPGIPVVLASGYSEAEVMAGDHPQKPQAFLSKPYGFETLKKVIHRSLAQI